MLSDEVSPRNGRDQTSCEWGAQPEDTTVTKAPYLPPMQAEGGFEVEIRIELPEPVSRNRCRAGFQERAAELWVRIRTMSKVGDCRK